MSEGDPIPGFAPAGVMESLPHAIRKSDSSASNDDGSVTTASATLSSLSDNGGCVDTTAATKEQESPFLRLDPAPDFKIVVLMSSPEGCEYDELDPPANVEQHLRRAGYDKIQVETLSLTPNTYTRCLADIAKRHETGEVACVFNLVDGAWDEPSVGIEAVELLENKLNVPFTGAGVDFFEPTRLEMKQVALACGARVPAWRFVYGEADLDRLLAELGGGGPAPPGPSEDGQQAPTGTPPPLSFPLLAKHFSSYSSIGLIKDSRVTNLDDLATQCRRMIGTYGGCLVEEFIEGREFTVLVAQEISSSQDQEEEEDEEIRIVAYEPVECKFGAGETFKHYNLKWIDYDNIGWHDVAHSDPDLARRLKAAAVNVFRAMRGRGYARLDFRSDPSGKNLYFLEINPNCGVLYPEEFYGSADFILDKVCPVSAHANFVLNQVRVAQRLWRKKNSRTCEARYDHRTKSWGLYSATDLMVGDVIMDLEEKPMPLVTKAHALRTWRNDENNNDDDVEMRSWSNFCSYCWPVSDDLFVMWSSNPKDWQPINHSCDPNAWNQEPNGLNVVARNPIRAGEEIRMDYATFCGYFEEMKPFDCDCGSPNCRRTITGMDILQREVAEKYDGHTSSYIASKSLQYHGRFGETDTATKQSP